MKLPTVVAFGALTVLFGLPVAFPDISQIALTQGMIVVVGYMVMVSDE